MNSTSYRHNKELERHKFKAVLKQLQEVSIGDIEGRIIARTTIHKVNTDSPPWQVPSRDDDGNIVQLPSGGNQHSRYVMSP